MKKVIFILCLALVALLVAWCIAKYNNRDKGEKYRTSELDNDIVIYENNLGLSHDLPVTVEE